MLLLTCRETFAQEAAPAAAEQKGVRITFLPPPLEGTLSLGVLTPEGKLVRVLAQEATEEKFTIGLNGLITHWDGRGADGLPLPSGKYLVRGYAVGELQIEGVAFHGNDWIVDENSPRLTNFQALRLVGRDLQIAALHDAKTPGVLHHDLDTKKQRFDAAAGEPELRDFSLKAKGRDNTTWTIDQGEGAAPQQRIVRQRDGAGELLRELEIERNAPQPIGIAAALDRDEVFLAERDAKQFRVRGLRLKETTSDGGRKISNWEVFFSKAAQRSDTFADFAALKPELKFTPEEKIEVKPIANPLIKAKPGVLSLAIGIDENGSFLRTLNGLPLLHVTDTRGLKWAVLGRSGDGKTVSLFQSDGVVLEEFRLSKLENIMACDAGEYEWDGGAK